LSSTTRSTHNFLSFLTILYLLYHYKRRQYYFPYTLSLSCHLTLDRIIIVLLTNFDMEVNHTIRIVMVGSFISVLILIVETLL